MIKDAILQLAKKEDISYDFVIDAILDRINPILMLQIQEQHAENILISFG